MYKIDDIDKVSKELEELKTKLIDHNKIKDKLISKEDCRIKEVDNNEWINICDNCKHYSTDKKNVYCNNVIGYWKYKIGKYIENEYTNAPTWCQLNNKD